MSKYTKKQNTQVKKLKVTKVKKVKKIKESKYLPIIKSHIKLDEYKILKELGYGYMGTVYLAEKDKEKYALKIEHVLESNIKNKDSKIFRENRFYKNFANKYPQYFVTMKDFTIVDDCKHIQKYPYGNIDSLDNRMRQLSDSKYCTIRTLTLVDGSLASIINSLTLNEFYSAIIQIYFITNFLHKNKYVQGDASINNVGYIKTNDKYIKLNNYMIPTFGYIYKLYDFGSVLHLTDTTSIRFNFIKNEELLKITSYLFENSIQYIDMFNENKYIKKIIESPEFKEIQNILEKPIKNPLIYIRMYEILNNIKFRELFNLPIEKSKQLNFYIPKEDIMFYIKEINNKNNIDKIINYFLAKIQ
jgi:serine/threonine protein kinase